MDQIKTYGRLKVLKTLKGKAFCECSCGTKKWCNKYSVLRGSTKSCGCLRREMVSNKNTTHGQSRSPTNTSWRVMLTRCRNKNFPRYKDYGGRGISVCKRWEKFENFLADMGERPPGTTLDRRDNNGNYTPSNCRWATDREQRLNKRSSRFITAFGQTKTLKEWSEQTGLNRGTIHERIKNGQPNEVALSPGVGR